MAAGRATTIRSIGMGMVFVLLILTAMPAVAEQPSTIAPAPATSSPGDPLTEPPRIRSKDGRLETTLRLTSGTGIIDGEEVDGMMLMNGIYPGPTLVANPGDLVKLKVINQLGETTNLHFHGMHVTPVNNADNPFREFEDGTTNTVRFRIPADHATGLDWYHPHLHGATNEQLYRGLAAMFLIRSETKKKNELKEKLLGLTAVGYDDDGLLEPENPSYVGYPTYVNGQYQPTITARPGKRLLLGFANLDIKAPEHLHLEGHTFTIVSEDGEPYAEPVTVETLELGPGKRFEVLIDVGDAGDYTLHRSAYSASQLPTDLFTAEDVATLHVEGDPWDGATGKLPAQQSTFVDLSDAPVAVEREMVLSKSSDSEDFYINGQQFDHHRIDVEADLDAVEEWTFVNESIFDHPMHIHTNWMQVMSINGEAVDPKAVDTVTVLGSANDTVGPFNEVVVRIMPTDFTGTTVFHCHWLQHEDGGMMGTIDYTIA